MSKLNKFVEKWNNREIADHGGFTSPDYETFQKEYRAVLKEVASNIGMKLHKFDKNHYEFSAVLKHEETNAFYYISISDVRYFSKDWHTQILYRTMEHNK